MKDQEFSALLQACSEVSSLFPEGVAFIGGIAVHLHAVNAPQTRDLAEFTQDADFYIAIADMGDLRDIEEVTPNRRQSKHQMVKKGFDFDIYTERQASLIVPYDAVIAHSKVYDGIRVACLEHLFVLKLEAFADRRGSAKGDKDAKDLLRIAAVAASSSDGFRGDLAGPFIRDAHLELLGAVERGPQVTSLAHGNAVVAKGLRRQFAGVSEAVTRGESIGAPTRTNSKVPSKSPESPQGEAPAECPARSHASAVAPAGRTSRRKPGPDLKR